MKNIILFLMMTIALASCKKEKKQEEAVVAPAPVVAPTVDELASKATTENSDWIANIQNFIDPINVCAKSSPIATKYVFRADRFESPALTLILFKAEDDRVYACSVDNNGDAPKYKEIKIAPKPKADRFYPGALPKADSCLTNTRILDKTGQIAGWLAHISC